jgi:hypothetical protein
VASDSPTPQTGDTPSAPVTPPRVPGIVFAMTALPAAVALVFSLLIGIISAVAAEGEAGSAFRVGPTLGALLLGQGLYASIRVAFLFSSSGTFGAIPIGYIIICALVLTRLGFVSAWLKVRRAWFLPAAAGGIVAFLVAPLLVVLGESDFSGDGFRMILGAENRPLAAFVVGAAPWLLAVLYANMDVARRIVVGLFGLQVLAALYAAGALFVNSEDLSFGAALGATLLMFIVALGYAANVVSLVVTLPFFGSVGIRIAGNADFNETFGLYGFMREEPGLLVPYFIILVAVAGVVALAVMVPPPATMQDALAEVRRFLLAATAILLPALWLGRIYGSVGGDAFGFGSLAVDSWVGSTGQPFRWIGMAIAMGVVHLLTLVVRARQAGMSWAADQALASQGRSLATDARSRAKSLAEQASAAAEAARAAAASAAASAPAPSAPAPSAPAAPYAPPSAPAADAGETSSEGPSPSP